MSQESPSSQSSSRSERLRTELDECKQKYTNLTQHIQRLETDLSREWDGERKLGLEERVAELRAKRDGVSAEIDQIEHAIAKSEVYGAVPVPSPPPSEAQERDARTKVRVVRVVFGVVAAVLLLVLFFRYLLPLVPTEKPPPPTPLPATSPAPTVTRMASVDNIARDSFDSPDSGWDIINESYGSSGYDNGKYFIDLFEARLFLALWEHVGSKVDNTVMEVDILGPLNRPGQAQGLGFGWQKDWKGTTYAFTVNGSGRCNVLEAVDKGGWHSAASGQLSQFDSNTLYHSLRAVIRNFQLQAYVDGELCITHPVPGYSQGYVGVVASPNSETNKDRFMFDEFRIYQIP